MAGGWFEIAKMFVLAGPVALTLIGGTVAVSANMDSGRLRAIVQVLLIGTLLLGSLIAADVLVGNTSATAHYLRLRDRIAGSPGVVPGMTR